MRSLGSEWLEPYFSTKTWQDKEVCLMAWEEDRQRLRRRMEVGSVTCFPCTDCLSSLDSHVMISLDCNHIHY